ncbi:MAG TPA: carbohydrate ABC transporter permease, partial [Spirochaetia bacterium]|nr:carbohydrate ABC transporter permease [Spirochaetia bacterium]
MGAHTSRTSRLFTVVVYIVMLFTLFVCLTPFLYMFALSFSSPKAIINNEVFLFPKGFNVKAYTEIFTYPNFFRAYGNTIFYTVIGT